MATVATGPAIDDLIRNTMPIDALWQPDSVSQRAETAPSRSASIKSKLDISSALPSLAASPVLSPRAGVFFLRSDAESLGESLQPKPHDRAHSAAPTSTSIDLTSPAASPESATNAHPFARPPSAIAAPPLTSSPSTSINDHADIVPSRSTRPGRPTLARLNTSEMLRRQTSTALEPATTRPAAGRRSPSALKLQLDTSVPRRSATLSSYPHGKKPNQRSPPHPTLTLLSPASSAREKNSIITGTTRNDSPARAARGDIEASADAHNDDVQRTRDNFSFENVEFQVSTILPDFLYLGPDVQTEEAVVQLKSLGVRRILNVACEIEDTGPLKIPDRFDRYLKLHMLDSVEAKGVQSSIEQACSFLDDARLRSEPVYVHCKAGKSRSVTIVIAYLIHALGWTLQRSYSHVSKKRTAICPNIGFVAELMRFEEKKLNIARSTGINIDSNETPPAGASKSTPHLLADAQQTQSSHPPPTRDTSPLVSASAQHDAHKHLDSKTSPSLVGSYSQSSPNLPSLKFGSN
ncbi:Protein-tyrosine-phosphatase [Pseudozyma hubeiensis]|nr:Protein-tyrosine-phosphatase [Pseudozyma hubeiensis]